MTDAKVHHAACALCWPVPTVPPVMLCGVPNPGTECTREDCQHGNCDACEVAIMEHFVQDHQEWLGTWLQSY